MPFDNHSNFGISVITVAPVPAATGTSLTVSDPTVFPSAPFDVTIWPAGVTPLASNAEIVRVTAIVGSVFTITRAQEGTSAIAIAVGFQIANTTSVKVFTDIEAAIPVQFVSNISAAGGSASGQVIFSNSNNVTFGMNAGVVTASAGAGGGAAISAGANSQSTGTVQFSNSNGVTFGLDGAGILTASHNGLTTQSVQTQGLVSINGSTGAIVFSNSNNVTFGGAGSVVTASASFAGLTSQSNQAASASNGSFAFQTLGFSNANGVTFGTSAGSIVTASVGAGVAAGSLSAGTTSVALGQVVFSNSNNVTFGLNGSTVTASVTVASTAQSTQPVAASASNGSFLFSTLGFSNANNVTFGTSAGGIITASVATAAAGNSVNFSAGTTSNNLGSIVFSNSNNVTFGLNGSTITASVSVTAAAAGTTLSFYDPVNFQANNAAITAQAQNTLYFDPLVLPVAISFNSVVHMGSFNNVVTSSNASATAQAGLTHLLGFYSRSVTDSAATNFSNSSALVNFYSTSNTYSCGGSISSTSISASWGWGSGVVGGSASASASTAAVVLQNGSFTGQKLMSHAFATSLSAGNYWVAQAFSTSTAGYAPASSMLQFSSFVLTMMSNGSWGSNFGAASNSSVMPIPGMGIYSVTSAGFPTSLALSEISNQSMRRRLFNFQA